MKTGQIEALNIYPVKSLQGIQLQRAELTAQGLKWDRFWMIVNEDGLFATQRHFPAMATIKTELTSSSLRLSADGHGSIEIPFEYSQLTQRDAKVWGSECQVLDEGQEVSDWLVEVLGDWRGQKLSLVRMAADFQRQVSTNHTEGVANQTQFADGYPILVTNTASLQAVNDELQTQGFQAVNMERFRGNVVVKANHRFVEHQFPHMSLSADGGPLLHLCKPCERCKITGIDQSSGAVPEAGQPLRTLMGMSHIDKKGGFFGHNAVVAEAAKLELPITLSVGQTVYFHQ